MENEGKRRVEDPDVLREEEEQEREDLQRKTEQGDELGGVHSIARKEGEEHEPYRPPRQPTLEQPEEEESDRGGGD